MSKRRTSSRPPGGRKPPNGRRSKERRGDAEPDLLSGIVAALDSTGPLDLLSHASALMAVLDARGRSPFDATPPGPDLAEFTGTLMDVPGRETSALLAAIAALSPDALLTARIRRELAGRAEPLPIWVRRLGDRPTVRCAEMTDELGDGDNIVLGVRIGDADEFTIILYVDHNLGAVVKDGFAIGAPFAAVLEKATTVDDAPRVASLDAGGARARVDEAIEHGARTFPPYETETWPGSRALVEWACRALPDGGEGYVRPYWTEADIADLAERFFASPAGRTRDDRDNRGLLESLLWYGTDHGNGDPMRWSGPKVEIVLLDWFPRKIIAETAYLARMPELLRALIGFAHSEAGVGPDATNHAMMVLDELEDEYQGLIRSNRPQSPLAMLAAVGALDDDDVGASWAQLMHEDLLDAVGGPDALARLDVAPLPDEEFDPTGIAADIVDRVLIVLDHLDRAVGTALGHEYRTACRRLLRRVALGDPVVFRRASRDDKTAAAVAWLVAKANEMFRDGLLVKNLLQRFGVTGSVSQRADSMRCALNLPAGEFADHLGSPDLLVSARRTDIISTRDRLAAEIDSVP